jgi:hypothetical protein
VDPQQLLLVAAGASMLVSVGLAGAQQPAWTAVAAGCRRAAMRSADRA